VNGTAAPWPPLVSAQIANHNLAQLPRSGRVFRPIIPAHWWPASKDSINDRWKGPQEPSPAEKAERAFGLPGFVEEVSKNYGRRGARLSWEGLCHGWAIYAMTERAPLRRATYNGVTFYPGDIEALMSFLWGSYFHSVKVDLAGEHIGHTASGGVNPGAFHVIATNLLGRGTPFGENRSLTEVWNHPVCAFQVTDLRSVSRPAASPTAAGCYRVQTRLSCVVEAEPAEVSHVGQLARFTETDCYDYILEVDRQGNIVVPGGEWLDASRLNHPSQFWLPNGKPPPAYLDGRWPDGLTYEKLKRLNDDAA